MIAKLASAFRAGVLAQQSRTQLAPRAVGVGGLARRLPGRGEKQGPAWGRGGTRFPVSAILDCAFTPPPWRPDDASRVASRERMLIV